jgi:TatA/E family protein of Tat protein translocase
MLAGPDLLVILVIALIVFGPKKLPELAKTIGKAMGEFKKTTEEVKESIGIKGLGEMRSNLTRMDLLADLAEKTSEYMTLSDGTKDVSLPKEESVSDKTLPLASVSGGNGEKGKNEKSEGVKDGS